MFKIKGNYPYPILLEDTIDYKTSKISARYLYRSSKNSHNIKIECEINNEEIKKLIEDKKACYAVQVESPNAMYRKMFEFYNNDEINITIENDEVIDYLDIGIAIIAKENIENYQNEDFVDAYNNIKMKVSKNEVLAVCQNVRQIITLNDEILKEVHSIFNLKKDDNINYVTYDPNYDRILITVPKEIGDFYLKCKGMKDIITILNSILFTPVLTSIINDMNEAEEEFSSRLWFKTLNNKINEIIKEEQVTREMIYDNPYEYAQKLLKNVTIESIYELKNLLEIQEGDDE